MGGYETALHLTGEYPSNWEGHRFDRPIEAWAAGKSRETTRDTQQAKLFGPVGEWGTGLIPKHSILDITKRANSNGAIDTAIIRSVRGGKSRLGFKCFQSGTRILMADGAWARVETIKLGDMVRCPDGVARPVKQLHTYADAPLVKIVARKGDLTVTPNHRVYTTNRGWLEASEIIIGDKLEFSWHEHEPQEKPEWRERLIDEEVIGVESRPNENVYCIGVDDVHELIANGFRVGNSYE